MLRLADGHERDAGRPLRAGPDPQPALAALLAEALAAPAYEADEIDGLRAELVNRMVRRLDDRAALATRAFEAVFFGAGRGSSTRSRC